MSGCGRDVATLFTSGRPLSVAAQGQVDDQ